MRSCEIPLQPTRTSFTATVRIGLSGPLRFLVDTGASLTVIDQSVADRLQIRAAGELAALSTSGPMSATRAMVPSLIAGSKERRDIEVLITSLPRFRSHGRLDGILGMNFFAGRSVLLDSQRRCVDVGVEPIAGTRLHAEEVVGRVAVRLNGLSFVVDSGASFVVLLSDEAKSLALPDASAELTTASGSEAASAGTIRRLAVGDRVLRNVPAAFARSTGDPREDGLLPITLFHSIYFSADRSVVVLK